MKKFLIALSSVTGLLVGVSAAHADTPGIGIYTVSDHLAGSTINLNFQGSASIKYSLIQGNVNPGKVKVSDASLSGQDYFTVSRKEFEFPATEGDAIDHPTSLTVKCKKAGTGHGLQIVNSTNQVLSDITSVNCKAPTVLEGANTAVLLKDVGSTDNSEVIVPMGDNQEISNHLIISKAGEDSDSEKPTNPGAIANFEAYNKDGIKVNQGEKYDIVWGTVDDHASPVFLDQKNSTVTPVDDKGKFQVTIKCVSDKSGSMSNVNIVDAEKHTVFTFPKVECVIPEESSDG